MAIRLDQIPETPQGPIRLDQIPEQTVGTADIGAEMSEVRLGAERVKAGTVPDPKSRPHIAGLFTRMPGGFAGGLGGDLPRVTGEPDHITKLREIREGPGTKQEKDIASKLVTKAEIDKRVSRIQKAVQAPYDQEAFQRDSLLDSTNSFINLCFSD